MALPIRAVSPSVADAVEEYKAATMTATTASSVRIIITVTATTGAWKFYQFDSRWANATPYVRNALSAKRGCVSKCKR
jgi:hypothetical protein